MGSPGWCSWANSSPEMGSYHDDEWGRPTADDQQLFERICLEAFQCGLSWSIVLARRARLREVFADFDFVELTKFSPADLELIARDPTVIRHRGKIGAVVSNARACLALVDEVGSLGSYLWSFAEPIESDPIGDGPPSTSAASIRLSKDLKKRGWTFVGPTTVYAMMQAIGMVNDHDRRCPFRSVVTQARSRFDSSVVGEN